ncbi:type II-A CRISPR-associated protein Csn2 [Agrilactobacillus yilanensis]|uniref:Type II-A CRISPR-associated protein Csn2 n=1 Tax=Agrilactobacillus yilanensis TaxID=2485997 RepID=A0ABW4JBL7_9LACO|nr:type II-A CRISPR-associated protein Csn2 [Agrilactobacillus yilanensis]
MKSLAMYSTRKFDFLDDGITIFQIGNRQLFWELQRFWQSEEHPNMAFSEDGKVLKPSKSALFIGDVGQCIDFNKLFGRQIITMIMHELDETQNHRLYDANCVIKDVVNEAIFEANLPIDLPTDWDLQAMLKYLKPQLELTNFRSAYDIIGSLTDITQRLSDKRLLIFTNIGQYLTSEQIKLLALDLKSQHQSVLFLEKVNTKIEVYQGSEGIKIVYIDNDFVEFENG